MDKKHSCVSSKKLLNRASLPSLPVSVQPRRPASCAPAALDSGGSPGESKVSQAASWCTRCTGGGSSPFSHLKIHLSKPSSLTSPRTCQRPPPSPVPTRPVQRVQEGSLRWRKRPLSVLSITAATGHTWLWSAFHVARAAEKLNF